MIGPELTTSQKANFHTLLQAAEAGRLCLLSCLDNDGNPVATLCAINEENEGGVSFLPLARQFDGNPYEELQDPSEDERPEGGPDEHYYLGAPAPVDGGS